MAISLKAAQCAAVVLTALALVPAGAHLAAMPNKIGLDREAYFTVQAIYRGWALFGFVLLPAIVANLLLAVMLRRQRVAARLALAASFLLAVGLVLFFTWTYPANQLTADWTIVPENWQQLRRQWEYAHAANALLTLAALCAVTLATVLARDEDGSRARRPSEP